MTALSKATPKRVLAGATVGIPPRQVDFQYPERESRYMFAGNATATSFLAVLSGIFPPGERFFVETVRHYRELVTDEKQKAEVSGFIGQEAIHGREHERLNDYLKARGINTDIPERAVRMSLWLLEQLPARQQLACTIMMEHFTAALAEQWLTDEDFRRNMDPEFMKLWQWHALEELEHKAVAYDVFDKAGGTWAERVAAVPLVVGALLPGILVSWGMLVAAEGKLQDRRDVSRGMDLLLGRKGLITGLLPHMPSFFGRRFHPHRRNTRALEQEWREKLFGAEGTLLGEWKNREMTDAVPRVH